MKTKNVRRKKNSLINAKNPLSFLLQTKRKIKLAWEVNAKAEKDRFPYNKKQKTKNKKTSKLGATMMWKGSNPLRGIVLSGRDIK
jgi:hypothetical protein